MNQMRLFLCLLACLSAVGLNAQTPADSIGSEAPSQQDSLCCEAQSAPWTDRVRNDSIAQHMLKSLVMQADEQRVAPMVRRYFDSGLCSDALLRYNYNELAGMDDHGIFVGNSDAVLISKWVLQECMGLHADKTIVSVPFLAVKEYREWLFRKLEMELPALKEAVTADDTVANAQALLQAIIEKYGSKVYFSSTTPSSVLRPWLTRLYNEGLLLKYSEKAYDNLSVKRRNVEERYMMEYLLVSFQPVWVAGQRMSANYAVVLSDVLAYYAKHDQKRYDWLMRLLVGGVMNTPLNEEHKQSILNLLMQ